MVPAVVVTLDALPLTRTASWTGPRCPRPTSRGAAGRNPRTAAERVLCGLFAEVLGLDRVGADDAFFELGGDSIVAMRLAARARPPG